MKLLFVGDVMLGRLVNQTLKARPPEYPWGNTLDVFRSADVRFCNLECSLSDRGVRRSPVTKAFHFRSDARNVEVLKRAGIDAASLANNHILDFNETALTDTLDILDRNRICRVILYPTSIREFQANLAEGAWARSIAEKMQRLCHPWNTSSCWHLGEQRLTLWGGK